MKKIMTLLCFYFSIFTSLYSAQVTTFYGALEVEEPVLLELIESQAFQRLKFIHQYGVTYYCTSFNEEYTRYDHSLGVFAVLRLKGATLKEQIAGLLHDVSHTVFSHVGDWMFDKSNQEKDYQNSIHTLFLERYGLGAILNKYGYSIEEILPEERLFPMLEKPSPDLCADRIDYNIQGAFYRGFISYEEALNLFDSLEFTLGKWVSNERALMEKVTRFSLYMTEYCWGSAENYLLSQWLACALLRGLEIDLLSFDDVHFGIDDEIWSRLTTSEDPSIQELLKKLTRSHHYYTFTHYEEEADLIIKSKFRGIDPWIHSPCGIHRLTTISKDICEEYDQTKQRLEKGFNVKWKNL